MGEVRSGGRGAMGLVGGGCVSGKQPKLNCGTRAGRIKVSGLVALQGDE